MTFNKFMQDKLVAMINSMIKIVLIVWFQTKRDVNCPQTCKINKLVLHTQ